LPSLSPGPAFDQAPGVGFFDVVDLVNRLEAEGRAGRQGRMADYLTRMDFIALDELGYLPFAQSGGQLLFQARMALLVNSLPLSETIIVGLPWWAISRSNSRATRTPDSEVSAMSARFSRVQLSTIASIRKRRPSVNWSETKSSDQRSPGASGTRIGALVSMARLRPPRHGAARAPASDSFCI
jgi:hypothetical protein